MQPEDNKVHEIWNASHHAPDDTLSNQQNIFLNSDWVKAKPSRAQPRPDLLLTLVTTFYLRHFICAEKASSLCNTRILRCLDSGGFLQFVSSQIFLVHFIANDISTKETKVVTRPIITYYSCYSFLIYPSPLTPEDNPLQTMNHSWDTERRGWKQHSEEWLGKTRTDDVTGQVHSCWVRDVQITQRKFQTADFKLMAEGKGSLS